MGRALRAFASSRWLLNHEHLGEHSLCLPADWLPEEKRLLIAAQLYGVSSLDPLAVVPALRVASFSPWTRWGGVTRVLVYGTEQSSFRGGEFF